MQDRRMLAITICASVAAFIAAMTANMAIADAQGSATPQAAPDTERGDLPHLAHINVGSCGELSHIVYKLDDVSAAGQAGEPAPSASPVVAITASVSGVVKQSTTTIDVSLDDLLADEHAINIHESIEAVDTYVACGDIGGAPDNGELEINMAEQNDSGLSGVATLTDNDDGTTTVVITLSEQASDAIGTPGATPAA